MTIRSSFPYFGNQFSNRPAFLADNAKAKPDFATRFGRSTRFQSVEELDRQYAALDTPEERMALVLASLAAEPSPIGGTNAIRNWATARFLQLILTETPEIWAPSLVSLLKGENTCRPDRIGPAQQYIALRIMEGIDHILLRPYEEARHFELLQENRLESNHLDYQLRRHRWRLTPDLPDVVRAVQFMQDDHQSLNPTCVIPLLQMTPICETLRGTNNLVPPRAQLRVATAARLAEALFMSRPSLRRMGEHQIVSTERAPEH